MPDLGTDMGNSGVSFIANVSGKVLEALLALINKIYELWRERTSPEFKLQREKLADALQKGEARKLAAKIEGSAGYVNHRDLVKAKVPLVCTEIRCSKEEFKNLAAACKRNGIVISALEDVRSRELGAKQSFIVECRESDLQRFADLCDAMNDARRIQAINQEILRVQAKGEGMTDEDQLYVSGLMQEAQKIREARSQGLNIQQAKGAIERAVKGKSYHGIPLDEAIDRWTGGEIDKDTPCWVVDAKDPDKYILATARQAEYRGEPYIKTTYEVYNGKQKVFETDDRRFDGRDRSYWPEQKRAIREKGGLGDTVIKFYSKDEMERYRSHFQQQNKEELGDLMPGVEGRDYQAIRDQLMQKIQECGAKLTPEGKVVDAITGDPLDVSDGMSDGKQAAVAEALVCAKQIDNYKTLEQLETELSVARAQVLVARDGQDKAEAVTQLQRLESRYGEAKEQEAELIDARKDVNFVQAEQAVRKDPEISKGHMNEQAITYLPEDQAKIDALQTRYDEIEMRKIALQMDIAGVSDPVLSAQLVERVTSIQEDLRAVGQELETAKTEAAENAQNHGGLTMGEYEARIDSAKGSEKPKVRSGQEKATAGKPVREDRP